MKTVTKKVAFNTIIQIFGRAILTVLSLLTIGIMARYLGVVGLGKYQTAVSYLAIVTVFADLGFFFILVRDLAQLKSDLERKKFLGNVLSIRILAGIIVYIIAISISFFIYKDPVVREGIILLSVAFFAMSIQNTIIAVLQYSFRMDKTVVAELVGRLAIFTIVFLAVQRNLGIEIIFLAYVVGNLLNLLTALAFTNRTIPISFGFDFTQWKQILNESAPLGLAVVLSTLYFKIDSVILSLMKTSLEVGIYAVPYKVLEVILIIPAIFLNTILPIYSHHFAYDKDRLLYILRRTFDGIVVMAIPVTFGLIALARPIIHLIGGNQFIDTSTISFLGHPATSVTCLQILALAAGLNFLTPVFTYLLAAGGLQKKLVITNFYFLLFNITANFILIPRGSYIAASLTTDATEILVLLTMIFLVYKHFGLTVSINRAIRALVAGTVMYGVIVLIPLPLVFSIIVGGGVYGLLVFMFKALSLGDLKAMIGKQ